MRKTKQVSDLEIDEISLVDKGANQYSRVAIAKRASEEDNVPEIYDEDGDVIELDQLQFGDVVFDEEGNAFEVVPDNGTEAEAEVEEELAPISKSLADTVREEISKTQNDEDLKVLIAKYAQTNGDLAQRLEQSERIAKSERDLRLTAEYVEIAKGYNVPVDPDELGPVLLHMAETMSDNDCAIIHKALTASGAALFDEIGYVGGGDNADPLQMVDEYLDSAISKSDSNISKSEAMSDFFYQNPAAYDEYVASRRGY